MTILSTLSAWQGPIALLLVILGPAVLRPQAILRLIGRGSPTPGSLPPPTRQPLPLLAKLLLALHTLYRLYSLFRPPYNIFASHHLPIFASSDVIRRHFLPSLESSTSPSRLDATASHAVLLLTKLASLDNRILYSRFGHQPLLECTWCTAGTDYLIAALPAIVGAYIAVASLLGVLGLEAVSGPNAKPIKQAWRGSASWLLAILAVGEVGVRYFWEIRITNGDAVQLDPLIHTLRTITLLLLPLIYTLLLPLPSPSPTQLLVPILSKIQNTTSTLRLTSLARTTAIRNPELRNRMALAARTEEAMRDIARADVYVQQNVESLGMKQGMGESARRWVEEGWSGLIRIGQGAG